MLVEDEVQATPALTPAQEDDAFATAVVTRALHTLPKLMPQPALDDVVRGLDSMVKAKAPREAMMLRILRKAFSCAVHDNSTIPSLSSPLHSLATALPSGSRAGALSPAARLLSRLL